MSRITNDTSTIQQALGFALVQVLSGSLLVVWIAWTMLAINWVYGLLSLAVVPLMAIATVWFSGQARKAFRAHAQGDRQRQRRVGGEHLRRARGAGLQPRRRQHRELPPEQRRQSRRQRARRGLHFGAGADARRRWAMSRSPSWPASAASSCCTARRSAALPSRWA